MTRPHPLSPSAMAPSTAANSASTVDPLVEQFRQRLEASTGVLDNLARVEAQFSDLAQTYQGLQDTLQTLCQLGSHPNQIKADVDQRLKVVDASLHQLRLDFEGFQTTFDNPREAVQIYIDNLENRLRNELRVALGRIEQSGFSPAQLDKLDKLDTQTRAYRTSLRDAERQIRLMKSWLLATSLVAAVALVLPVLAPLISPSGSSSGSSSVSQPRSEPSAELRATP